MLFRMCFLYFYRKKTNDELSFIFISDYYICSILQHTISFLVNMRGNEITVMKLLFLCVYGVRKPPLPIRLVFTCSIKTRISTTNVCGIFFFFFRKQVVSGRCCLELEGISRMYHNKRYIRHALNSICLYFIKFLVLCIHTVRCY